ncbi:TPA: serine/threonine protein kinase [Bacillus wiedmannii]|nr:serine/threonine protein kinase [Bacillus wiedmannii]
MSMAEFKIDLSKLTEAFPELTILEELGEGGQKIVYKAISPTGENVALKIIKLSEDPERVKREIQVASQLPKGNFPEIFKWGSRLIAGEEIIFVVEEFVQGKGLRENLQEQSLTLQEVIEIGIQLLNAIIQVEEQKLVHRDIKPENIILADGLRVVLLDFGIARHLTLDSLTHDAAMFGPLTPGYGAPEQIKNEKRAITFRTDLFAWAVVMYEMISGVNPFREGCSNTGEVLTRTLQYNPPSIQDCPKEIQVLIDWCLKKPVHRRPPNTYIVLQKMKEVSI